MKLDILAIMAHPDDAELSCSGTLIMHAKQGKKVGIVDLTQGQMGTNGTPAIRLKEAEEASRVMGLAIRENLGFEDVLFENDLQHQLKVVEMIRKYRPEIVIANALSDRHPDHAKAARLTATACFMSGLKKLETKLDGKTQEAWRPRQVFHIIQSNYLKPDFVVDISEHWNDKVKSIQAYQTQFHVNDKATAEKTFISTPAFMQFIESRHRELGQAVGAQYAEGFQTEKMMCLDSLFDVKYKGY